MYKSLSNIGEVCFFVNMKQPWRDITLLKAIAGRLRELRAEKGVSQETVYEDTGIHIGKIETEKYNITVSTLARLCRYYGISLGALFDQVEDRSDAE